MKKSKLLILGLIALMLAGGLALGCVEDSVCKGKATNERCANRDGCYAWCEETEEGCSGC